MSCSVCSGGWATAGVQYGARVCVGGCVCVCVCPLSLPPSLSPSLSLSLVSMWVRVQCTLFGYALQQQWPAHLNP